MVCTSSAELLTQLRDLRSHGQTGPYLHTSIGYNMRMTDVEAAIGREQLKRLGDMIDTRRRNGAVYQRELAKIPGIQTPHIAEDVEPSWHQYCLTVDADAYGRDRDGLISWLKKNEIGSGIHYPRGLHQQPVFEQMFGKQSRPAAEKLAQTILAIPVHHGMSEADVDRVVQVIADGRK